MRRYFGQLATSLVLAFVALATTASPASAHHDSLHNGTFEYHDIVDGSQLTLQIYGHAEMLSVYDDAGSICRDAGLGFVPAFHYGTMEPVGADTWDVTGAVWCRSPKGWVVVLKSLTISYEIRDNGSSIWDHTGQPYKHYGDFI